MSEAPTGSALTRNEMRELDRKAIEELGIPSVCLMELAGLAVADEADSLCKEGRLVVVVAGRGNNGGDGYVAARHLSNRGVETEVLVLAPEEQIAGDARINLEVILRMGVFVHFLATPVRWDVFRERLQRACVMVDALLGTGLKGDVREPSRQAIEVVNGLGRPVVSVDIPSGLDCDKGEPLGIAVKATTTVTFARAKVGLLKPEAARYVGRLVVADIGIPPDLTP